MSTLINRLVKQALTTFRFNEPNLAEIEKLMSLVTAEDVFFDWKRVRTSRAAGLNNVLMLYVQVLDIEI